MIHIHRINEQLEGAVTLVASNFKEYYIFYVAWFDSRTAESIGRSMGPERCALAIRQHCSIHIPLGVWLWHQPLSCGRLWTLLFVSRVMSTKRLDMLL